MPVASKVLSGSSSRVGLGCMELAINEDRLPLDEGIRMLHELYEQHQLTFVDTADCYCLCERDFGYGDKLVREFAALPGAIVATKVGMCREGTKWVRNGKPEYLRSAVELSVRNSRRDALSLCQLHAPDPDVPLLESLGELALLREEGKIEELGVCNVTLEELRETAQLGVSTVQNPLSLLFFEPDRDQPLLEYCEQNRILLIAYAPLGGLRNSAILRTPPAELEALASELAISVYDLALEFVQTISPITIAIPGSNSLEHTIQNLRTRGRILSETVMQQIRELLRG